MTFEVVRFLKQRVVFFQAKNVCITVMIVSTIFLSIPQILFASDVTMQSYSINSIESSIESKDTVEEVAKKSIFKKNSNVIYQFLDNHEYLFAPISGMAAGLIRCGFKCAIIGGVSGVADELLINFGYMDRRYTLPGVFLGW